jgi:hypothetical protein
VSFKATWLINLPKSRQCILGKCNAKKKRKKNNYFETNKQNAGSGEGESKQCGNIPHRQRMVHWQNFRFGVFLVEKFITHTEIG